jgi:hypothetical protein
VAKAYSGHEGCDGRAAEGNGGKEEGVEHVKFLERSFVSSTAISNAKVVGKEKNGGPSKTADRISNTALSRFQKQRGSVVSGLFAVHTFLTFICVVIVVDVFTVIVYAICQN